MPKFKNSIDIVKAMYTSYSKSNIMPNNVTFLSVDWNEFSSEIIKWLTDIPKSKLTGSIRMKEGSDITFVIKDALNKKFGNIDNANGDNYNGLLVKYTSVVFAGGSIRGNYYNDGKNEYQFSVFPTNPKANTFTNIVYSATSQYSNVYIDKQTGILRVVELSDLESITTITATVYLTDGSTVEISKGVEIYNRQAKLGDLVYADGSFGSPLNDDNTKTVVGICCYVADDSSGLYNPNDVQKRLMVAPNYIYTQSWGIEDTVKGKSATGASQLLYFPGESISNTTVYKLPNSGITNSGIPSGVRFDGLILPDKIGDYTYGDGTGMQVFQASTAAGRGFSSNEETSSILYRTLDYELALLAGDLYKEGDIVNAGYAETLKAIQQRNKVLTSDIQYNTEIKLHFSIPSSNENRSETENLLQLIDAIQIYAKDVLGDSNYTRWQGLYFPAPSLAYAYEPTGLMIGETLSPKFKSHNWFLPPSGLLLRLRTWTYAINKAYDIFEAARIQGKCNLPSFLEGAGFFSSTTNGERVWESTQRNTGGGNPLGAASKWGIGGSQSHNEHYIVCAF